MMAPSVPERADIACACLIVLDGWGIAAPGPGNAINRARKPNFDRLWNEYPHAALDASGPSVGPPDGQMGNSEVGHLTLGAGAVVPQTLTLIDNAVAAGALAQNEVLRGALSASERVHLVGLVSDGGVHSGFGHLHALIELAAELQVRDLVLHCFTDGRDTSPTSGEGYLTTLDGWCRGAGAGRVATVVGRYWAMDRDRGWERTQAAYDVLVHGRAEHHALDGPSAARAAYERGETDEFIRPIAVGKEGRIHPSDSVLCFNFRPDRMRQIVRALAEPGFGEGTEELPGWRGRGGCAPIRRLAMMTEYQKGWSYPVAFEAAHPATTLGAVIEAAGERQLHVAETEKYAHVTYFFNGGREQPYDAGASGASAIAAGRVRDHRRPRERRPHARGRRQPEHGAFAQPGAADRHRSWADAQSHGHTGRCRPDSPGAPRNRTAHGDDRPLAAQARAGAAAPHACVTPAPSVM
jgi:2,3-bisphosphoglycerate-independent phosphoglycerate mutase